MRLILLLLASLLVADTADAQRKAKKRGVIRGIHGEVLNRRGDFLAAVGGNPSFGLRGPSIQKGMLPKGVYEVTLPNTGTGWEERFLIGVPTAPLNPAPLLVVFHGYGEEHTDMVTKTSYFQEGMARGWIVIAPLGAHKYNYAIDYAQENVELALTWAATYLTLDPDRFYGVGFSMGGGMASSFAARHQDALGPRFAAVAVHSGTCSMRDVYWSANDKALLQHPDMFGGNPDQVPFRYVAASTVDLDTVTGAVDQDSDLVRNLQHTPLYHFLAQHDPNTFLLDQTQANHDQALLRGGDTTITQVNESVHQWWTLEEAVLLDWFEPKTLQGPADGQPTRVVADRDARWFGIRVQQAQTDALTPFRWATVAAQNRVYLDEIENASLISLDPVTFGLDDTVPVELIVNNTDGLAVEFVLEGYDQAPVDVWRAGASTGSWSYDAATKTVHLYESSAASYPLWKVWP